ncbi:MAG: hypothetical protein EBU46_01335 [Nitrosomonadaceae bacterium]|nr:hypothetical protein [Nitrosomonadaceae bacterium]
MLGGIISKLSGVAGSAGNLLYLTWNGQRVDPYEFTLTAFNGLIASDYAGITVRVTNIHTTSAGVGGVLFTGGASWTLESPQIYYATYATGIAAFPAASYPGLRMCFGDVGGGRVVHISNGTRYMPEGGRFTFFQASYGTVAAPTQTIAAGVTSGTFTLAGSAPTIPANYLSTGFALQIKARFQRHGVTATIPAYIRIGTAGTSADADMWAVSLAATDLLHTSVDCYAMVTASNTLTTNSSSAQSGGGGTGQLVDKTANVNIASAMIISSTCTKNTADSIDLLSLMVEVVAPS